MEDLWDLTFCNGLQAGVRAERRNKQGFTLLEYVAINGNQDEYSDTITKLYGFVPSSSLIQIVGHTILRLFSCSEATFQDVNYKILIAKLKPEDLVELLSQDLKTCWNMMYLLLRADTAKATQLLKDVFNQINSSDLMFKAIMNCSQLADTILLILTNDELRSYLMSLLTNQQLVELLMVPSVITSTVFYQLVQHDQSFNIPSLLRTLSTEDKHSVLNKAVVEFGAQNLLEKATTERLLSIIDLYAGEPDKLAELFSTVYRENTDPTINGSFNLIREWVTLYLLCVHNLNGMPENQALSDIQHGIAERLNIQIPSASEVTNEETPSETSDFLYRDMIVWACRLGSPEISNVAEAINALSDDTKTNRSLLQLIFMFENKLKMDDWEFGHLINVVCNCYDQSENNEFINLLLTTAIQSSACSIWQVLISPGILSSIPSMTHCYIKQACRSSCSLFIKTIMESMNSPQEFHLWLTTSDDKGRSALSYSVGNMETFLCIMQFYELNQEIFAKYLQHPHISRNNFFHTLIERGGRTYLSEVIDRMWQAMQQDFNSVHSVIRSSHMQIENLTVVGKAVKYGHTKSFQKLVELYDGHKPELMELIQMRDSTGKNLIHHAISQDSDVFIQFFISALDTHDLCQLFQSKNSSFWNAFQNSVGYWGPFRALAGFYQEQFNKSQPLLHMFDDISGSIVQNCAKQSDPAYIRTLQNIFPDFDFLHQQMKRLIPGTYKQCSALQVAVGHVFSFHAILDFYSNKKEEFFDLLSVKDKKINDLERIKKIVEYGDNKTAISYAAATSDPIYLTSLLNLHKDFERLHQLIKSDVFFNMSLIHFTAWQNGPVEALIDFYGDSPKLNELLTEKGLVDLIRKCENGMTPFSVVTNILSFYNKANREADAVKGLLSSESVELMLGSVFLNKYTPIVLSDYLAKVDKETRLPLYKEQFEEKLRDLKKKDDQDTHIYHLLCKMLDWAKGRWRKYYTMPRAPSVIIIYNSKDRDGAEKEARCLIDALAAINLHVDVYADLNENDMMEAIKRAQLDEKCRSGQIVIIMSHGIEGCVCDNNGKEVPISDIENIMAPTNLSGCPKVLILQCCQKSLDGNRMGRHFDAGPRKRSKASSSIPQALQQEVVRTSSRPENGDLVYSKVRSRDFIVIKSTVDSTLSRRNLFIGTLAKVFKTVNRDDDLVDVFNEVSRLMQDSDQNEDDQIPVLLMTAHLRFCLRGSFQTFLEDEVEAEDTYRFIGLPAVVGRGIHLVHPAIEGFDKWEKRDILLTLERSSRSERGENGMLTLLFAEGNVNHFHDNLNQAVFFVDIERAMTKYSHPDKPKIAIIHTNRAAHSNCKECDRLDRMRQSGVDVKGEYEPKEPDFAVVISHAEGKGSEHAIYLYLGLIWSEMGKLNPDADLLTAFGKSLEQGVREAAGGGKDAYSFNIQVKSKLRKKMCLRVLLPAYDFAKRQISRSNLEQAERNWWDWRSNPWQDRTAEQMGSSADSKNSAKKRELVDDDLD